MDPVGNTFSPIPNFFKRWIIEKKRLLSPGTKGSQRIFSSRPTLYREKHGLVPKTHVTAWQSR